MGVGGFFVLLFFFSFHLPLGGNLLYTPCILVGPFGCSFDEYICFYSSKNYMCLGLVHPTLDSRQVRDALNYKRQG